MNLKVYSATSYDGGWAEVTTNNGTDWETVDPNFRKTNQSDYQRFRDLPEWKSVSHFTCALLNGSGLLLYLQDVLLRWDNINFYFSYTHY